MRSGIPEGWTPRFWENVSRCCGTAGVGEHFLALHRLTGEESYRRFADRPTNDLLRRSTEERDGLKWTQAEHRVRPDLLVAQAGFMQGADEHRTLSIPTAPRRRTCGAGDRNVGPVREYPRALPSLVRRGSWGIGSVQSS